MRKVIISIILLLTLTVSAFAATNVVISGEHTIDGVNSGTRTFILTPKDGGKEQKITVNVNKSFTFPIEIGQDGEYEYTIKEESIKAEGLIQDDTVYTVKILVRNGNATTTIQDSNGKVDKVSFTDKYTPPTKSSKSETTAVDNSNPVDKTDNNDASTVDRIVNKAKTGDPILIIPAGVLLLTCIGVGALTIARRRKS